MDLLKSLSQILKALTYQQKHCQERERISIMMAMYPTRILKCLLNVGCPSERAVERASSRQKTSTKQNKSYTWQQFAKVAINVLAEFQRPHKAVLLLFALPSIAIFFTFSLLSNFSRKKNFNYSVR